MSDSAERTAVYTYVPEYQKSEWSAEAEALGMSQSEFVRTMVQAGRRGFVEESSTAENPDISGSEEGGSGGATPGGSGLEDTVLEALDRGGALGWDALVDAVVGDVEDEIEDVLDELQASNRVRYSGRDGGYVLVRDE
ncbi:DUF5805 domain-containing protein [Halocalculus aciditolerans]|uniref:Uncharacterized protein n=1 Tax=Halocalculus aciditolerans TaxID=1383812 RepID=A0A830FB10_9EURY|nr:DUF5805 domain-containing protein [Halocalculus aciditolerans]GGL57194.1 hypothetical protein GCM10009039_14240 [Halocalculus aciditolerans]